MPDLKEQAKRYRDLMGEDAYRRQVEAARRLWPCCGFPRRGEHSETV